MGLLRLRQATPNWEPRNPTFTTTYCDPYFDIKRQTVLIWTKATFVITQLPRSVVALTGFPPSFPAKNKSGLNRLKSYYVI